MIVTSENLAKKASQYAHAALERAKTPQTEYEHYFKIVQQAFIDASQFTVAKVPLSEPEHKKLIHIINLTSLFIEQVEDQVKFPPAEIDSVKEAIHEFWEGFYE